MSPDEPGQPTMVDFERAVVVSPMIYPPRPRLVVSGTLPYPMTVELVPRTYVRRPEYWGIEVVGRVDGGPAPMPAITNVPYVVELDLEGFVGTVGVEVIGATRTEEIAVPVADGPAPEPQPTD